MILKYSKKVVICKECSYFEFRASPAFTITFEVGKVLWTYNGTKDVDVPNVFWCGDNRVPADCMKTICVVERYELVETVVTES